MYVCFAHCMEIWTLCVSALVFLCFSVTLYLPNTYFRVVFWLFEMHLF
jgi:hypothetical protein